MTSPPSRLWAERMDQAAVYCGALVPMGIAMGNAGFEATIILTGLCWIIGLFISRRNPLPGLIRHPILLPWTAWYGCILISLIWNGPGNKGWAHDVVLIRHLIFFAALLDISKKREVARPLLIGLGLGIFWAALNTLLAHTIGHDLMGKSAERYANKLKEAERIPSLAAYAAPFFLSWTVLDKTLAPGKRVLLATMGLSALVLLLFFRIRTAILGAGVGLLLTGTWLAVRFIPRKFVLVLFLSLGLAGGLGVRFLPHMHMNLDSMYDRINIWKVAWIMWQEHPFVGVSVSKWQDVYAATAASGRVTPFVSPDGRIVLSPDAMHCHSLFFQVLSSTGILGALVFVWLFISIVRMLPKPLVGWRYGLIPWPAVFLVIGLTGWNIFGAQYLPIFAFWLVLTALPAAKENRQL